jgi:hypothetical protein
MATSIGIYRLALPFDTSSIPSNAVIDSATLTIGILADSSSTNFDIVVTNGQPDYPHSPPVVADYNKANYSGDGGSINTSGISDPFVLSLNATGLSWITKGGTTKLLLRSSLDVAGTEPTEDVDEFISFKLTSPVPKLTVTYHTVSTVQINGGTILGNTTIL